jgi:hypothetical protein
VVSAADPLRPFEHVKQNENMKHAEESGLYRTRLQANAYMNSKFVYSRLKHALSAGFIKCAGALRLMNTTRTSIRTVFSFRLIINNTGYEVTELVTTFLYFRVLRTRLTD